MENNRDNGLLPRPDRVFFSAGNLVELKHDIPNKPQMVVVSVDKLPMKVGGDNDKVALLGVTCIWFSTDCKLQSHRFSTKDLVKIKGDD